MFCQLLLDGELCSLDVINRLLKYTFGSINALLPEEEKVYEGHPFDVAQDRLSHTRPFGGLRMGDGVIPLCSP